MPSAGIVVRRGCALLALGCVLLAAGCAGTRRPAWELPPPPVRDAPVVDEARLSRSQLDNGLRVIVLEDHRLPRFELGVVVRRGAGIVTPERAGLSQYTAELMERGAGERTALELAGVVDRLGASLSVSSGWDSTAVHVSGLSRDLDVLFEVLLDVVLRPRFDADEAERVLAEHLASLEQAKDDPNNLVRWNLARALYPGHRYGLPAAGTPESVSALGPEDARAFHGRIFTPSNAIFHASGDLDPEALLDRVKARLGDWTGEPPPRPGPPPPAVAPEATRIVVVDRPDLGQAQIAIGHEGIARSDPRRVQVMLLNTVLGQSSFSSRLMTKVRSEEGLTYGIGSSFVQRRNPGPLAVSTFTRVPETRRVVDLVLAELARLRSEPPQTEELARAQSLRTGSFGLQLETSAAVVGALVDMDVHGLPEDSLDTFRRRVRAVTPADAAAVAEELVHPERVAIVVVGPAEELVPLLKDLGPVEVEVP